MSATGQDFQSAFASKSPNVRFNSVLPTLAKLIINFESVLILPIAEDQFRQDCRVTFAEISAKPSYSLASGSWSEKTPVNVP
jgi:hypothetical protein